MKISLEQEPLINELDKEGFKLVRKDGLWIKKHSSGFTAKRRCDLCGIFCELNIGKQIQTFYNFNCNRCNATRELRLGDGLKW